MGGGRAAQGDRLGAFQDGQALLTELELKDRFGSAARPCARPSPCWRGRPGAAKRGSGTYVTHGPRKHGSV